MKVFMLVVHPVLLVLLAVLLYLFTPLVFSGASVTDRAGLIALVLLVVVFVEITVDTNTAIFFGEEIGTVVEPALLAMIAAAFVSACGGVPFLAVLIGLLGVGFIVLVFGFLTNQADHQVARVCSFLYPAVSIVAVGAFMLAGQAEYAWWVLGGLLFLFLFCQAIEGQSH